MKNKMEFELDRPWVLMNPGPINLTDSVRLALLQPDLCHREPEFQTLLQEVRSKINQIFTPSQKYTNALLAGSGTAAVEAMILSGVKPGGKLLSIENGVYGERVSAIAKAAGIELVSYHLDWGESIDFDKLESIINEEGDFFAIAGIHHETTTGMLNDVKRIGEIAKKYNLKYFLDSVSGLGAEEIDIESCNLTLVASTANKGIHGVPGVAFVIIDKEYLEVMKSYPPRSVYFNLPNYIACQDADTIPFTMPVHVLYAFNQALKELETETVAGRLKRFLKRANVVRDALEGHYEFYLDRKLFSNTMTSLKLPENISYDTIHSKLKGLGIVLYAGQGGLAKSIFRIAHLGEYDDDKELPRLIDALLSIVSK